MESRYIKLNALRAVKFDFAIEYEPLWSTSDGYIKCDTDSKGLMMAT